LIKEGTGIGGCFSLEKGLSNRGEEDWFVEKTTKKC